MVSVDEIRNARDAATSAKHTSVAQLISDSEEAHPIAIQGNVKMFCAQIEAAALSAPLMQWVTQRTKKPKLAYLSTVFRSPK